MDRPEGYEVTEYGREHEHPDHVYSVIKEIVQEQVSEFPNTNIQVSFTGNLLRLTYHCYEMHLPVRMRDIEAQAKAGLDATLKNVKKKYKERTRDVLDLKEKKDMSSYSVQKVSLNERYYYASWRFYEFV